MALAPFFDKTALSAATFLRGFNRLAFEQKLKGINIGIVFDGTIVKDSEQFVAVELSVNLLARLYPILSLICSGSPENLDHFRSLALRINPQIEIRTTCDGLSAAIATVHCPLLDVVCDRGPIIYIGSAGWVAKVSTAGPLDWGKSQNCFGAAAAACLGVANVFRHVFRDQLADPKLDENLVLNLFNYSTNPANEERPDLLPVDLSGTTLIGAGAIGNAVVWMFRRLLGLHGTITVVDHESIELSNLQRYVLADGESIGRPKVDLVENVMAGGAISVRTFSGKWSDFLESSDWNLPRLAVAVDSVQERIKICGSLAKEVLNAWTQVDEVGISRHFHFGETACLCCLYFPDREVPSESEQIGAAVGLPNEPMLIRDMLQTGKPVDRAFLEKVASALRISPEELFAFEGKDLRRFYSEAICGGLVFRLGATADTGTEVPMAFQSALAGIFLAAEIVIASNQMRGSNLSNTTRLRIAEPISENLLIPVALVDRCICQDPDFRSVYHQKYSTDDELKTSSPCRKGT